MAGDQPSEAQALRAIERLVADPLLPRVVVAVRKHNDDEKSRGENGQRAMTSVSSSP